MLGRPGRDSVYNRSIQEIVSDNRGPMGNGRNGKAMPNGPANAEEKFSLISNEKLIALYQNLLRSRRTTRNGGTSNGNHSTAPSHPAAIVGTAIDLGPGDVVCSLDRQVLSALFRESAIELLLFGSGQDRMTGLSGGKNGSGSDGASACRFTHAAIGTALANKTSRNGKVAVVYCAEANADDLSEAVHIASVHGLPMVFVQQLNSKPAGSAGNARTKKTSTNSADETPWFPSITVDANDVVAVYRVASEAISRARLGRGPTLIECRPYRLTGKRDSKNGHHSQEAIQNMEHYLRAKGLFDPKLKRESVAESGARGRVIANPNGVTSREDAYRRRPSPVGR